MYVVLGILVKKSSKIDRNKRNSQDVISSLSYIDIPTDIFRTYPLAVLETIVVYLKEERNLNFNEISVLLGRDQRNIWTVYSRAKKKLQKSALKEETPHTILNSLYYITIPSDIFRRYPLAVLESIVVYLKDERYLNFHEIAVLLGRDQRNIWTVYQRARRKLEKNK